MSDDWMCDDAYLPPLDDTVPFGGESAHRCDWQPDEFQPAEEGCPYCAGRMCARFDGLNCRHDRVERHGEAAP